jgi:toxin CcdB
MTISYFDVVPNPVSQHRNERPFYVCVQHTFLNHLRTRVMAPLLARQMPQGRLHPPLKVGQQTVFLDPTDLVTMDAKHLGQPVANLSSESFRITAALDLVFTGV